MKKKLTVLAIVLVALGLLLSMTVLADVQEELTPEQYESFYKPYMVEFETTGLGTVTVSGGTVKTCGNMTKVGWDSAPTDVSFTVTPAAGEQLESVWIEQESDDNEEYDALQNDGSAYQDGTLTYSPFLTDVGEATEGGFVLLKFNFSTSAWAYIDSCHFAYYGENADAIKNLLATELWNRAFGVDEQNTRTYFGQFADLDAFKGAITVSGDASASDNAFAASTENPLNLPYYEYSVTLSSKTDVVASGNVYVLENAKQFVVMDSAEVCTVVDISEFVQGSENNDIYVYSSTEITEHTVFGNGVCEAGRLSAATGDYESFHVTQEGSGIDTQLGCRLVVFPDGFVGVSMVGDIRSAAFGFDLVPVYSTSSNPDEPRVCEVYYGNDGRDDDHTLQITTASDNAGSKTQFTAAKVFESIAVNTDLISGEVATVTGSDGVYTIRFNSAYDVIPMVVTYTDGTEGYIEIHRVGLHMSSGDVDGSNKYTIWHGTDNDPQYSSTDRKVVTASFYYNTGEIKPTEHVSLFVTIQTTAETIHKVVNCLNSDFMETTGGDKWADDFLLWSGSNEEYDNLLSVSAIVYDAGDGTSFGGVKVGSGTGVEWVKPE